MSVPTGATMPSVVKLTYYQQHRDEMIARAKQRYANNREKLLENAKAYMRNHKDKMCRYMNRKVLCKCGKTINYSYLARHERTAIHLDNVVESDAPRYIKV